MTTKPQKIEGGKIIPTIFFIGVLLGVTLGILFTRSQIENAWLEGACTVEVRIHDQSGIFRRMGCYKKFPQLEQK